MQSHLDAILAKDAIRDLVLKLARAMDRNDRAGILACYHSGAIDHHGEVNGPVEEFVGFIDLLHRERVDSMFHLLGNHLIEVNGYIALGELYVTAWLRTRGDAPYDMVAGGRYLDRYEQRRAEWRLAERRVVMDWQRFDPIADLPGIAPVDVQERGRASLDDPSYRHFASSTPEVNR